MYRKNTLLSFKYAINLYLGETSDLVCTMFLVNQLHLHLFFEDPMTKVDHLNYL